MLNKLNENIFDITKICFVNQISQKLIDYLKLNGFDYENNQDNIFNTNDYLNKNMSIIIEYRRVNDEIDKFFYFSHNIRVRKGDIEERLNKIDIQFSKKESVDFELTQSKKTLSEKDNKYKLRFRTYFRQKQLLDKLENFNSRFKELYFFDDNLIDKKPEKSKSKREIYYEIVEKAMFIGMTSQEANIWAVKNTNKVYLEQ